jgi:hypothetical protein
MAIVPRKYYLVCQGLESGEEFARAVSVVPGAGHFRVSYIFYDRISSASIACSNIWNCDRM